ncbi:MAG: DMT family transporter [Cytophagales bacterium]|nr:DMT family transporter [Cytophagales bacterium]
MIKSKLGAHLAMLCAGLLYGGSLVISNYVVDHPSMTPLAVVQIRSTATMIVFVAVGQWLSRGWVKGYKDLIRLILCGAFGASINMIFFFEGLEKTSPLHASLIMVTVPIVVLVFSRLFSQERISWQKVLGLCLGVAGTLLLLDTEASTTDQEATFRGDLFIVMNAIFYGFYLVLLKPLMKKYHPITVAKGLFLSGSLISLPFCYKSLVGTPFHTFSAEMWGGIAYVIIGATVLTFFLNIAAMTRVNPSAVGYYVYVQPLFASFLHVFMGKSAPTWAEICAAILIFSGVFLISRRSPSKSPLKQRISSFRKSQDTQYHALSKQGQKGKE